MILTHNQLALENSLRKILPAGVVSCWIPDGYGKAKDVIGGNHGTCFGTHPNVPIISGFPIEQINACDVTTGWMGTSLSIDTDDKKEGSGSLKNTIAAPVINTYYNTRYDITGTWDWSDKEHILLWLYCDRASTAFGIVRFSIYDTPNNSRYWDLTFSAGEWTAFRLLLSTGDGESATPPDLASINYFQVYVKSADETPFYLKLDDVRVTGKRSLTCPSVGWHFDKVDDVIVVPNDKSLNSTDEITVVAMIYPRTFGYGNYGRIVDKNVGGFIFSLYKLAGQEVLKVFLTGDVPAISDNYVITLNEWNYVGFNYHKANGSGKFWVNAQDAGDIGDMGSWNSHVQSLCIGNRPALDRGFDGYIALLALANKSWSQQRHENFGNAIKSLFSPRGF